MHSLTILAASHAAKTAPVSRLAAVVTALITALVVVILLKIAARILTPKKKTAQRSSSPYSAPAGRR